MACKQILLIEAFYGGSHKQLMDLLLDIFPKISDLYSMPAKKWHWRSITSPLHFATAIPKEHDFRILFTSSVLPLAELCALRPDLAKLYKIVYFHENQLVYPVQERKTRYFQHGYNDVLTCLVADKILFNSNYNKDSFLKSLHTYFNVMPDYRPRNLDNQINQKCEVAYFPIHFPKQYINPVNEAQPVSKSHVTTSEDIFSNNKFEPGKKLHIVWPHRWEHDKDPEALFSVLYRLKDSGECFNLSVIGETFTEKPKIFEEAEKYLEEHILHWGYQLSKTEYYKVLQSADVVVSTALHEFFGVSMLEATYLNCYPLCPNRLAYPEIYPEEYLYNTANQLYKRLRYFCRHPFAARHHKIKVDLSIYSWETLKTQYTNYFIQAIA